MLNFAKKRGEIFEHFPMEKSLVNSLSPSQRLAPSLLLPLHWPFSLFPHTATQNHGFGTVATSWQEFSAMLQPKFSAAQRKVLRNKKTSKSKAKRKLIVIDHILHSILVINNFKFDTLSQYSVPYSASFWSPHCEKSLFVLASRQKIPALRTEIPAVDTRTIFLLPIEFFLNYPCQKSYGRKIPARNNRYGRKFPAFWCQKR